jgi:hypothetical protein
MLNLWLVLRVLNEITTSVGPLTIDMPACVAWAAREKAAIVIDKGTGVKPEDVVFSCEYSVEVPGSPEYYRAKKLPGS